MGLSRYVTNLDRHMGVHSDGLGITEVLGWQGKGWSSYERHVQQHSHPLKSGVRDPLVPEKQSHSIL